MITNKKRPPVPQTTHEASCEVPKDPVVIVDVKGGRVALSGRSEEHTPPTSLSYYDVRTDSPVQLAEPPVLYHSKMEMVELAQKGVKSNTIKDLIELLDVSITDMAGFFHFSERTLRDYIKQNKVLDPDSSEKVLKILSLYLYGSDVFESSENFIKWLYAPSYGLQNKIPVNLLYSSDGIDLVHDEISRIEHGDLA